MRMPMSAPSHDQRRDLPEQPTSADVVRDQEVKLIAALEHRDQLQRELVRREREIGDLRAQIRELESANSSLAAELYEAHPAVEIASLRRSLDEAQRRLVKVTCELDDVRHSTAWRVVGAARHAASRSPRLARVMLRAMQLVWWTLTLQLFARIRRYRAARKIAERV
jgi:septal ring factor EnvC (AmiA/AmiB activator)